MPWFPDFVAAAEMARRDVRAEGQSDPVAQYLMALTQGKTRALETTWPGRIVILDPYAGEVHGHRHLREFVHNSQAFLADRLVDVERIAATSVAGRAVVEVLAHLKLDGEPVTWPVAVVAESPDDQSVTFRAYGSQWPVVGQRPVRAPILESGARTDLPEVVRQYLTALDAGDTDAIMRTMSPTCYLREPIGPHLLHQGADELRAHFTTCFSAGGGIGLEACRVTDDGERCALEYNCTRWGRAPRAPQAGIAVFERDRDGRIGAVRVYDDVEAPVGP